MNEGICIGGPMHGQEYKANSRYFNVAPPIKFGSVGPMEVNPEPEKINAHRYDWQTFHFSEGDVSCWKSMDLKTPRDLLVALINEATR